MCVCLIPQTPQGQTSCILLLCHPPTPTHNKNNNQKHSLNVYHMLGTVLSSSIISLNSNDTLKRFFFFFFFLATLTAHGSSQARDQIQATAVTYTTAVATMDPYPTALGQRSNPCHCSDNTRSLTFCVAAGTPIFKIAYLYGMMDVH